MNDDQQRIAIAELCGWKHRLATHDNPVVRAGHTLPNYYGSDLEVWWNDDDPKLTAVYVDVPDYPNSLDAMHEAEKILDPIMPEASDEVSRDWDKFEETLHFICEDCDPKHSSVHADSHQRAEAFLRTLGRWKETTP